MKGIEATFSRPCRWRKPKSKSKSKVAGNFLEKARRIGIPMADCGALDQKKLTAMAERFHRQKIESNCFLPLHSSKLREFTITRFVKTT